MGSTITVVGSGSSGNSYILKSGGDVLIIDIGCKFAEIIRFVDDLRKIAGCAATHAHLDHLNQSTAKEFIRRGIPVFFGEKVYEELLKEGSIKGVKPLPMEQKTFIGGFVVQPFETPHNVPNYGFLIETPTKERIVFVTDAMGCPYNFKDIDCIMVECNYDEDTLIDNFVNNDVSKSHPENHLGLDECISFCKRNISFSTKQIILIHMSSTNINPFDAVEKVKNAINDKMVKVDFAESGRNFIVESDFF